MSHWQKYHARWAQIQPPLRPNEDVVERLLQLAKPSVRNIVLLGVTPELADAFGTVTAIDKNPAMIANVWPGDSATKAAIEADWLQVELPRTTFDAVIGDGSLNNVSCPEGISILLQRAMDWLVPGGVFACRLFERPADKITADQLLRTAGSKATLNFHAFKWQIAMHIAASAGANVPVSEILRRFNELCPDRDTLAATTGWPRQSIDTIDVYRGSDIVYSFPDRSEFQGTIPTKAVDVGFHAAGTYDLAECCPILSFRKPG